MEELLELKGLLIQGNVVEALQLVEEMTEMSKDDKLNKIFSFSIVLLLHLIKQRAENRTTRSWDVSIRNAVRQIQRTNKRRKAKGHYLTSEELQETLADAYSLALDKAALEIFEGRYDSNELASLVDQNKILAHAFQMILQD